MQWIRFSLGLTYSIVHTALTETNKTLSDHRFFRWGYKIAILFKTVFSVILTGKVKSNNIQRQTCFILGSQFGREFLSWTNHHTSSRKYLDSQRKNSYKTLLWSWLKFTKNKKTKTKRLFWKTMRLTVIQTEIFLTWTKDWKLALKTWISRRKLPITLKSKKLERRKIS